MSNDNVVYDTSSQWCETSDEGQVVTLLLPLLPLLLSLLPLLLLLS